MPICTYIKHYTQRNEINNNFKSTYTDTGVYNVLQTKSIFKLDKDRTIPGQRTLWCKNSELHGTEFRVPTPTIMAARRISTHW